MSSQLAVLRRLHPAKQVVGGPRVGHAFQRHLLLGLHDTGYEPAFALMDLSERPLVATINFAVPHPPADRIVLALADRCFGAAYFRYHGLA